jgi:hypothetical protein
MQASFHGVDQSGAADARAHDVVTGVDETGDRRSDPCERLAGPFRSVGVDHAAGANLADGADRRYFDVRAAYVDTEM